ncbi:MAG: putative solute:sodium symporter small subunit [Rhodoferax sp.]
MLVVNGSDSADFPLMSCYLLQGGLMEKDLSSQAYWKATIALLTKILIIWFLVSFGAGILLADLLNNFSLGGYPLGFWFAQQGSIYIFVVLIFYYAKKMGDIDRRFDVHED